MAKSKDKKQSNIDTEKIRILKAEIEMAKKLNKDILEPQIREAIERYTGEHVPLIGPHWDIYLNDFYSIIQFWLPSIFFRNPRSFLKPRNKTFIKKELDPVTGRKKEVQADSHKAAKTQEHILNYIISEIGYKGQTQKVLMDALMFKFGILWHGYKGNFGMTDEQSMMIESEEIFVERLNPMRFLKDPAVGIANLDKCRWTGRSFDVPLSDLQEDDTLNVTKQIKGRFGFGDKVNPNVPNIPTSGGDKLVSSNVELITLTSDEFQTSARSKFVEVFEIFERPSAKEKREGKKGKVYLISMEQEEPLRINDWPYSAEGWPGHILEFNTLNDQQFGLADIDVYKSILDQKNAIINIQLRNAEENSKVWVGVSVSEDEEDIEKIRNGANTIIVFPPDVKPSERMFIASPGGQASSELYLIDGRIQANLDDKSGVSDLRRGVLKSGEESAESVRVRESGSNARPAYRQDIMSDFLKRSFKYINQLEKQFFTIKDAVRIMGTTDIEWSEKPSKEEIQADVDVEIDAISMLPENPEKELLSLREVMSFVIEYVNNPALKDQITKEGKVFELAPIINQTLDRLKLRDPSIFRNIKPEEAQGFAPVAEIQAAVSNVAAIAGGQQLPSPPTEGQDHKTRLGVYTSQIQINQLQGVQNDILVKLAQLQAQILEAEEKSQTKVGNPVSLKKGGVQTV